MAGSSQHVATAKSVGATDGGGGGGGGDGGCHNNMAGVTMAAAGHTNTLKLNAMVYTRAIKRSSRAPERAGGFFLTSPKFLAKRALSPF